MTRNKRAVKVPIRRLTTQSDGGCTVAESELPDTTSDAQSVGPVSQLRGDQTPANRRSVVSATGSRDRARPPSGVEELGQTDWRTTALRLQADMQTYRHRQQRRAEDQAAAARADLLRQFLGVADDLEQSLGHLEPGDPVHEGVRVAYTGLLALLTHEGVTRISSQGKSFDPDLHEAVATVPVRRGGGRHMRVVEVLLPGYRIDDRLLRPAKVVVGRADGHA